MSALSGTFWERAYALFGVANDEDLVYRSSIIYLAFFIGTILWNIILTPIKYGKLLKDEDIPTPGFNPLTWTVSARSGWTFGILPALLTPMLLIFTTTSKQLWNFSNFAGVMLFLIHYINRALIYPRQISQGAKPMEVWYCFGMIFPMAIIHGFVQTHCLLNGHETSTTLTSYIGLLIALIGMSINIYHDKLLTNLRKDSSKSKSKTTVYKIPRGGLFEYVSCANFFGEMIEWIGVALLTKAFPQITLAVFTVGYLGTRAVASHEFYKKNFPNYPKNRKILIPFVF